MVRGSCEKRGATAIREDSKNLRIGKRVFFAKALSKFQLFLIFFLQEKKKGRKSFMPPPAGTGFGIPVTLHVYNLISDDGGTKEAAREIITFIGMGVFHTGIEVYGGEWSFGGDFSGKNDPETDGVFCVDEPKTCLDTYKESFELGTTTLSQVQFMDLIKQLKIRWKAITYHILNHNCNCFTYELAGQLAPGGALQAKFPKWVNRAATVGDYVVPGPVIKKIMQLANPPGPVPEGVQVTVSVDKIPKPGEKSGPTPTQIREHDAAVEKKPEEKKGGLMGLGMGLLAKGADLVMQGVEVVDATVRSTVEAEQLKKYKKMFPSASETFVAYYTCKVPYVNSVCEAQVFITDKVLYVGGDRNLSSVLPYSQIASIRLGVYIKNELSPQIPPTFELIKVDANGTPLTTQEPTTLMIYTIQKELLTLYKFGGVGAALDNQIATRIGTTSAKMSPLMRAFSYLDSGWRAVCLKIPLPGVTYENT